MPVGGDALEVGDLGGGRVSHPPTGPPEAPTEVDVLGVHEVGLVEAAHLFECGPPHQEARSRHPVDSSGRGSASASSSWWSSSWWYARVNRLSGAKMPNRACPAASTIAGNWRADG